MVARRMRVVVADDHPELLDTLQALLATTYDVVRQ